MFLNSTQLETSVFKKSKFKRFNKYTNQLIKNINIKNTKIFFIYAFILKLNLKNIKLIKIETKANKSKNVQSDKLNFNQLKIFVIE
jgi:hypothetical protein